MSSFKHQNQKNESTSSKLCFLKKTKPRVLVNQYVRTMFMRVERNNQKIK